MSLTAEQRRVMTACLVTTSNYQGPLHGFSQGFIDAMCKIDYALVQPLMPRNADDLEAEIAYATAVLWHQDLTAEERGHLEEHLAWISL